TFIFVRDLVSVKEIRQYLFRFRTYPFSPFAQNQRSILSKFFSFILLFFPFFYLAFPDSLHRPDTLLFFYMFFPIYHFHLIIFIIPGYFLDLIKSFGN